MLLRVGIIGVGGFAGSHHSAIQALEEAGICRLVCTCDPGDDALNAARAHWNFDGRGVRVWSDYQEMLDGHAGELDVVTIPTPPPLHAEMHRACVERSLACYLEKPPTLDPDELERMIAADASARKQTQVAFNFIIEEPRQALKRRLRAGEFGTLRRASFVGLWPRASDYFGRAGWAGRLVGGDDRLILDSCIGNALAHHVHNLLFWAGSSDDRDDIFSWASPALVWAELYRAHAIEGLDTAFVRAECDNGVELRLAATHACDGPQENREVLDCDRATITYVTGGSYEVIWKDGQPAEQGMADRRHLLQENLRAYFAYVRGEASRPLTRLVDSRPFVHLNALAYLAAGTITRVGAPHVRRFAASSNGSGGELASIAGVREAAETFAATGRFPSEQGLPWAAAPGAPGSGPARPTDLPRLLDVVRGMTAQA